MVAGGGLWRELKSGGGGGCTREVNQTLKTHP